MKLVFHMKQLADGLYTWELLDTARAGPGRLVCVGKAYPLRSDCMLAIETAKSVTPETPVQVFYDKGRE